MGRILVRVVLFPFSFDRCRTFQFLFTFRFRLPTRFQPGFHPFFFESFEIFPFLLTLRFGLPLCRDARDFFLFSDKSCRLLSLRLKYRRLSSFFLKSRLLGLFGCESECLFPLGNEPSLFLTLRREYRFLSSLFLETDLPFLFGSDTRGFLPFGSESDPEKPFFLETGFPFTFRGDSGFKQSSLFATRFLFPLRFTSSSLRPFRFKSLTISPFFLASRFGFTFGSHARRIFFVGPYVTVSGRQEFPFVKSVSGKITPFRSRRKNGRDILIDRRRPVDRLYRSHGTYPFPIQTSRPVDRSDIEHLRYDVLFRFP